MIRRYVMKVTTLSGEEKGKTQFITMLGDPFDPADMKPMIELTYPTRESAIDSCRICNISNKYQSEKYGFEKRLYTPVGIFY